jgi:uncharacterized membrane protein YkoI
MNSKLKTTIIAGTAIAALAAGGVAVAGAAGGDDDASDRAIQGQALDRASRAALEHTGGGRVTETEAGDEEGAYEVEVTRDDGTQVDVHLDAGFKVLAAHEDGRDDGPGDD